MQARQDLRHRRLHVVDHLQCGRLAVAQYGEQRAARAVGADDAGLHRVAVAHLRHVANVDRRAVDHLDRQVVQLVQHARAAVELDLVIDVADLGVAGGQNQVLVGQRVGDVDRREPLGEELVGIQIHHHLPEFAAVRQRHGRALNGGQLGANEVLAQVEEFLLAQGLALQAELQDGNAGCVVLDNAGRGGAGRKDAQQGLGDGGDLRKRHFHLGVGLEVDARDGDAVVGLRLDVLDVVDGGGHGPLEDGDHALFHLFGREAAVAPHDADHRDIDVRKDVHRHGDDGRDAQNRDEHRHDHEGIRAPKGESDYPHCCQCTFPATELALVGLLASMIFDERGMRMIPAEQDRVALWG